MAKQVQKAVTSPRSAAKTVKCASIPTATAVATVKNTNSASGDALPTALLDKWVADRNSWNHDDWNGLVNTLRTKGFDQGLDQVGQWIEERRAERQIPKAELDAWVTRHGQWDHADWLVLLGDLRDCGYASLADSPYGQKVIGLYIETRRNEIHCSKANNSK